MSKHFDTELNSLFAAYSRSIDAKQDRREAAEQHDRDFNARARLAEQLAEGMDGFNPNREAALSPVDAHRGEAHYFINGFAGMPIKLVNPRKAGAAAVEAFKAGQAKRRELGA